MDFLKGWYGQDTLGALREGHSESCAVGDSAARHASWFARAAFNIYAVSAEAESIWSCGSTVMVGKRVVILVYVVLPLWEL